MDVVRFTYAAGDAGTVLKKVDDGEWTAVTSPAAINLRGVWVSPTGVVWVSGAGGNVYRSTDGGETWEDMEAPTSEDLFRAWGFDDDYFFVAGNDETVLQWHNGTWTNIGTDFPFFSGFNLRSVWGLAPDALWVGGSNGRIYFWNGSAWVHRGFGTNTMVQSVRGFDADNVFATGPSGGVRKWDGTASTTGTAFQIQSTVSAANGNEVWPTASDAIWIARQHSTAANMALWNGEHGVDPTLHEHGDPGFRKHSVWGFDETDGYACGVGGNIIAWDGATWTHQTSGTSEDLWAVHGGEVPVDAFLDAVGTRYHSQLLQLLPPGRALPRETSSVLSRVLEVGAAALSRLHHKARAFLEDETDPHRTEELLERWEQVFGLPDHCRAPEELTLETRRADLLTRMAFVGRQSIPFYQALAEVYGYEDQEIEEFRPFRAGQSTAGDPCGDAWVFAFRFVGVEIEYTAFRAGASAAGHRLRIYERHPLACAVARIHQSHVFPVFDLVLEEEEAAGGPPE